MARPLSADARGRMLRAAADIIGSEGPGPCTVDEVARRSGVAKTTIYRHFGTSEELVFAVVDAGVKRSEAPDTGTLRGDLAIIQRAYLDTARSDAQRRLFGWMVTKSMEADRFAAMFRSVRVQPRGPTVIALQRAIARGEVRADLDIDLAMHLIQGPFTSKRIIAGEDLSVAEFDSLLDAIIRALTI